MTSLGGTRAVSSPGCCWGRSNTLTTRPNHGASLFQQTSALSASIHHCRRRRRRRREESENRDKKARDTASETFRHVWTPVDQRLVARRDETKQSRTSVRASASPLSVVRLQKSQHLRTTPPRNPLPSSSRRELTSQTDANFWTNLVSRPYPYPRPPPPPSSTQCRSTKTNE